MSSFLPCKKNDAAGYTFYVGLISQADTKILQANPTLAAGDVKIAIDDGAPANLGTLPVVDADFTKRIKVVLSQAECNGDNLTLIFSDASGAEWCDLIFNIQTVDQRFDDIPTAAETVTAVMTTPTSDFEASSPLKSLGTAIMKAVHRIRDNAGVLEVYRSNGTTLHGTQTVTTDETLKPIDELGGTA